MQQVYVVHYHEIALKGRNRPMFERVLKENICRTTGLPAKCVRIVSGRLIVYNESHNAPQPPLNLRGGEGGVIAALSRVFGISSFSPAMLVRAEYGEIEKALKSVISTVATDGSGVEKSHTVHNSERVVGQSVRSLGYARDDESPWQTFAIATTRGDKRFPMTSQEINIKLGAYVNEQFGKKVNLTDPEVTFYVEVFSAGGACPSVRRGSVSGGEGGALVYTQKIPGPGGLPVGSQSKVAVMLSGGIDSPVAAYRIMKRGASIIGVHCHSYPFTTRASIDKVKELASVLAQYGGPFKLYLVPLADAQKAVVQNTEPRYRILLYRRMMVRIAQEIARREGAGALVTGESLGQVASQTVENIAVTDAVATMPILRPLIGYDKEEIISEARKIGTYEISVLPHDDCCTLFMPKDPATRARMSDVEVEERKINVAALIANAINNAELITPLHLPLP